MPASPGPAADTVIALNQAEWFRVCQRLGLATDTQRAAYFGLTRQTICLVQNGRRSVGDRFIAAVLPKLPHSRFEDLFKFKDAA